MTTTVSKTPRAALSGFDRTIFIAAAVIIALIVLTIALGDRVGVTLERVAPLGTARATSAIVIQFSEPMNRDSLGDRLRVEPAVEGAINWSAETLIFQPNAPLTPGETYTVVLEPGAVSENGRAVLAEYRYSFSVQRPRVAYLAPADGAPLNVWMAEPGDPASARQITASTGGIYDFAISPNGQQIAFSETNSETNTEDIKLLDLETGALRQLTNCVDASCTNPTWRPDGRLIAYERIEYNTTFGGFGASPARIWLLDPTTEPATTYPLFSDTQVLGYDPQWSADGRRIALFDRASGSIFVYDFDDESGVAIPSSSGVSGALSPDGLKLIFPDVQLREGQEARTYLQIADLESMAVEPMPGGDEATNDQLAVWSPSGDMVAVARRFLDQRFTVGYQILLIDPVTGETRPLTDDPRYTNGFFSWDASGGQLVIQRLPLIDEQGQRDNLARPEIWTLDVTTGALMRVAENAFHPRWVP